MLRVEEDQVQFKGRTSFVIPPDINDTKSYGIEIPDVSTIQALYFINDTAITVTNFVGGVNGRPLFVIGDGFTSVDNNTTIKTSTGAIKLLGLHLYIFMYLSGVWYEMN